MKSNKPSRQQILSSCSEIGPDDGIDPRIFFRKATRNGTNRKALQMCGEIARTLQAVLGFECNDDLLRNLQVESVQPAPDSTRVLVSVSTKVHSETVDVEQILARLHAARGRLRTEVASAISRKRVPELIFRVVSGKEVNS